MIVFAIFICNLFTQIFNYFNKPSLNDRLKLANAKIASMTKEINYLRGREATFQRMKAILTKYANMSKEINQLKQMEEEYQTMKTRVKTFVSMSEEVTQLRQRESEYQKMYAKVARYAGPLLAEFDHLKSQNRVLEDEILRVELHNLYLQQTLLETQNTANEEKLFYDRNRCQLEQWLGDSWY